MSRPKLIPETQAPVSSLKSSCRWRSGEIRQVLDGVSKGGVVSLLDQGHL